MMLAKVEVTYSCVLWLPCVCVLHTGVELNFSLAVKTNEEVKREEKNKKQTCSILSSAHVNNSSVGG